MTERRRGRAGVAGAVLVLLALAGCGGGEGDDDKKGGSAGSSKPGRGMGGQPFPGKSGERIAQDAVEATRSAGSLRMKEDIDTGGERTRADLSLTTDGDCTGWTSDDSTGTTKVRVKDGNGYVNGDDKFWDQATKGIDPSAVAELKGRWVKVSGKSADGMPGEADFTALCDLDTTLSALKPAELKGITRGKRVTLDGKEAFTLTHPDGSVVWVAAKGEPYLLKIAPPGTGGKPQYTAFSEFGAPVKVVEPPADEVIDGGAM